MAFHEEVSDILHLGSPFQCQTEVGFSFSNGGGSGE